MLVSKIGRLEDIKRRKQALAAASPESALPRQPALTDREKRVTGSAPVSRIVFWDGPDGPPRRLS